MSKPFDFSKTAEFAKRNELMYDDPFYFILGTIPQPEVLLGFPKWELFILYLLPLRVKLLWYKLRLRRVWRHIDKDPYNVKYFLLLTKYSDNVYKAEISLCKRKNT